jgi:hypothetical protein
MKKILAIIIVFAVFASCKKLEDLNKNTKDPSTVSGESLFTGAQKRFIDQMVNSNVNYNIWRLIDQYWNETTYEDESNYNLVNRSIPDDHWNVLYENVLKNLDEAKKIITATTYTTDASPAIKKNKLAIVDVMAVHAWSVLVETFGNIPYSQALDINNLHPQYDDGKTVYENLINRLTTDIANMDASWGSFDAADNIYQGNVTNWIKYATSLKLRMGMLLCDADPTFAKTTVESAAAGQLIQGNADNATITYSSAPPNTNPMYADQVETGRHDFIAAATIIDTMNNWNDPRRPLYFTQVDTSTTGTPKLAYIGGAIGLGGFYTYFSNAAAPMWKPTFQGLIMDYAEVEFLLAEAVERGYSVTGTAASHYNKGVTASIEYWEGSAADAATYLAQPNIAYNTAPGNYKQKIGMQQWIAYYNRGFEGWTEQRKMDYPALVPGVNALSGYPVRYTYPIEEQTLNGANYSTASTAIGGDVVTTKLFWDKY